MMTGLTLFATLCRLSGKFIIFKELLDLYFSFVEIYILLPQNLNFVRIPIK